MDCVLTYASTEIHMQVRIATLILSTEIYDIGSIPTCCNAVQLNPYAVA